MIIGFDIDGVLINFVLHLVNTVKKITGYELPYPAKEYYTTIPGYDEDAFNMLIGTAISTIGEAKPIINSTKYITKIYNLFKEPILFITARPKEVKEQTLISLHDHIKGAFPYIVRFKEKGKKKSDYLDKNTKYFVEDTVKEITDIAPFINTGFIINSPWHDYTDLPKNIIVVKNTVEDRLKFVYKFLNFGRINDK